MQRHLFRVQFILHAPDRIFVEATDLPFALFSMNGALIHVPPMGQVPEREPETFAGLLELGSSHEVVELNKDRRVRTRNFLYVALCYVT